MFNNNNMSHSEMVFTLKKLHKFFFSNLQSVTCVWYVTVSTLWLHENFPEELISLEISSCLLSITVKEKKTERHGQQHPPWLNVSSRKKPQKLEKRLCFWERMKSQSPFSAELHPSCLLVSSSYNLLVCLEQVPSTVVIKEKTHFWIIMNSMTSKPSQRLYNNLTVGLF